MDGWIYWLIGWLIYMLILDFWKRQLVTTLRNN